MTYMPLTDTVQKTQDINTQQLLILKKIETHLSKVTGESIKEEDVHED